MGNYKGGPSVTVFGFPQDESLKQKRIHVHKKKKICAI